MTPSIRHSYPKIAAGTAVLALLSALSATAARAGSGNETFALATNGQSTAYDGEIPRAVFYNFGNQGIYVPIDSGTDPSMLASNNISGTYRDQTSTTGVLSDSLSTSGSGLSSFGNWTFNGSTSVSVQSGQLKSVSQSVLTGNTDGRTANGAESYGIARDTLTVNSPDVAIGADGSMVIALTIDGMMSVSGKGGDALVYRYGYGAPGADAALSHELLETSFLIYGNGYSITGPHSSYGQFTSPPGFNYDIGPLDAAGSPSYITYSGKGTVYATVPISFSSGFEYDMGVFTSAVGGSGGGSAAVADFSHTATITGIQIFDSNGSEINDFSITSGSGAKYDANGVHITGAASAPEPSALALLAPAVLGIFAIARRRRAS